MLTHNMAFLPTVIYQPHYISLLGLTYVHYSMQINMSMQKSLVFLCVSNSHIKHVILKRCHLNPDRRGSVGWASACKTKVRRFDSRSQHMPGLRIQSPVGPHMRGNWSMFLSHICFSLTLMFLSLSSSLPSPLSKNR